MVLGSLQWLKYIKTIVKLINLYTLSVQVIKENKTTSSDVKSEVKVTNENLPDWQYVRYKVVHHMTLQVNRIKEIGFNVFDNPPLILTGKKVTILMLYTLG